MTRKASCYRFRKSKKRYKIKICVNCQLVINRPKVSAVKM